MRPSRVDARRIRQCSGAEPISSGRVRVDGRAGGDCPSGGGVAELWAYGRAGVGLHVAWSLPTTGGASGSCAADAGPLHHASDSRPDGRRRARATVCDLDGSKPAADGGAIGHPCVCAHPTPPPPFIPIPPEQFHLTRHRRRSTPALYIYGHRYHN